MRLGYCPQKPNLNPYLTLEQNLIFAGRFYGVPEDAIKERIAILAKRFGLQIICKKKLQFYPAAISNGL